MFGFLSGIISGTSSKQTYTDTHKSVPMPERSNDGLTGVARYLQTQDGKPKGLSGVEKYLKERGQVQSSVTKYLARQAVAARKEKKTNTPAAITGVAAYLENNADKNPVKSGVTKYLLNRKETKVSGVSKYMLKQMIATKNKPITNSHKVTGVTQYLKNKPTPTVSSVAKYLAKQKLVLKQSSELNAAVEEEVAEPLAALTGVEKYLNQQTR